MIIFWNNVSQINSYARETRTAFHLTTTPRSRRAREVHRARPRRTDAEHHGDDLGDFDGFLRGEHGGERGRLTAGGSV